MRGRKPKPTAQKRLEGNAGKRPLNQREPRPAPGAPEPPAYLGDVGREEWRRKCRDLPPGLLTKVDDAALGGFCLAFENLTSARADLAENGRYQSTDSGCQIPRPAVADEKSALLLMAKFGALLGLDPSSRTRIQMPDGIPKTDVAGDAAGGLESFNARPLRKTSKP